MMEVDVYYAWDSNFSTFEKATIMGAAERVPKEHLLAGIVVKGSSVAMAKAALYINPHMRYKDFQVALVGAYEALENTTAVRKLFDEVEKLARLRGRNYLVGPMNGLTWEEYRFQDDITAPSFFTEKMHPAYYPEQWKAVGFEAIARYHSAYSIPAPIQDGLLSKCRLTMSERGVSVRQIDLSDYAKELERLYPFLLKAFEKNFLYTPISRDSFLQKYLPLKPFLHERYTLIAEHQDRVVSLFLCLPDPMDKNTLIVKTIARDPSPAYRGLGHVIMGHIYEMAYHDGYERLIYAFMKDDGTVTGIANRFNERPFKTYSLYGKPL